MSARAETPILWPPDAKSWLIGKDSDAGRDWGQEDKGTTEDEMAGWHHWLDGHESEWTPEVGDGQGDLACCDSWGRKESDTTKRLIWSDLIWVICAQDESNKVCFLLSTHFPCFLFVVLQSHPISFLSPPPHTKGDGWNLPWAGRGRFVLRVFYLPHFL